MTVDRTSLAATMADVVERNRVEAAEWSGAVLAVLKRGEASETEVVERIGWRWRKPRKVERVLRGLVDTGAVQVELRSVPGKGGHGVLFYRLREGAE